MVPVAGDSTGKSNRHRPAKPLDARQHLHRDAAYRTLLSEYQQHQTTDQVLQVAVEAGGLGCDLTIALPLELARQVQAADGPGRERGSAAARAARGDRG